MTVKKCTTDNSLRDALALPAFLRNLERRPNLGGNCSGVFLITPEVAAQWLGEGNRGNRPLNLDWANTLRDAILRGEWRLNGDAIAIGGDLLSSDDEPLGIFNGQHRLTAIHRASMSVWSWIVWGDGIENDAFVTYDFNRKRSTADAASIDGRVNCRLLAAIASLFYRYKETMNGDCMSGQIVKDFTRLATAKRMTPMQGLKIIQDNPGIDQSATFVRALENMRESTGLLPSSFAGFMHFMTPLLRDECETFLGSIVKGTNLEDGNPALLFRNRMLSDRASKTAKLPGVYVLAILIKSWNSFVTNEKMKQLKWINEPFPRITVSS